MKLSEDSKAILLLCSSIATRQPKKNSSQEGPKPLTLSEWNTLARMLPKSSLQTPQGFFETDISQWKKELAVSLEIGERLQKLLTLGGSLAIELDNLERLGIWVTTRAEATYPTQLKTLLRDSTPPVLFGAGDISQLNKVGGVAVVGSRDVDERGAEFARKFSQRCAAESLAIVSGGARGVDQIAESAALSAGGRVIEVLADDLAGRIRKREVREALRANQLVLVTPFNPESHFTVWSAMERNKLIYAFAQYAVVVAATEGKGGTWAGATENLKAKWTPLFVYTPTTDVPVGNQKLLNLGALALSDEALAQAAGLSNWFAQQVSSNKPAALWDSPAITTPENTSPIDNSAASIAVTQELPDSELVTAKPKRKRASRQLSEVSPPKKTIRRVKKAGKSAADPETVTQLALFENS